MSLYGRRSGSARGLCECCGMPDQYDDLPFPVDHIIAVKHGGPTSLDSLAQSCYSCNVHKGPNVAGIDPETGEVERLFHPRRDDWNEHFVWRGPELIGLTPAGRATVGVLAINLPYRQALRESLAGEGVFPVK